jgi:F1F0 ATPase subunit 2
VRRLPGKERPAAFLLGSFVLRGGVALAGFWLLFRTGWQGLAAALAGFLAVRLLLVRRLGPAGGRDACGDKGGQPA